MANCKSYDFSKVGILEVYPYTESKVQSPIYGQLPVCSQKELAEKRLELPFRLGEVKCQDKVTEEVYGIIHQLTLTWELRPQDMADKDKLTALLNRFLLMRESPYEVVLTIFGGHRKLLRTTREGYHFSFQEEDGVMKCSLTLTNGQGVTSVME